MAVVEFSRGSTTAAWQDALRRWLQWNDAYEQLTAQIFEADGDSMRLEALADQLDQFRLDAVIASRALLE